jgi:hypothetical protein
MVTRPTLKTKAVLAEIGKALVAFARERGWTRDQYQLLFRVQEEWGRITAMLVVEDLGGLSEEELRDQAHQVIEKALDQSGGTGFSLGLTIRERSQVERGGRYTIPDSYVEAADLLPASSLDDC